jgi:hypothetical protein
MISIAQVIDFTTQNRRNGDGLWLNLHFRRKSLKTHKKHVHQRWMEFTPIDNGVNPSTAVVPPERYNQRF